MEIYWTSYKNKCYCLNWMVIYCRTTITIMLVLMFKLLLMMMMDFDLLVLLFFFDALKISTFILNL
jgi:hypothetical protein